jgi:plastocyanin/uncharacterized membrane protein
MTERRQQRLILVMFLAALPAAAAPPTSAVPHIVVIRQMHFEPPQLRLAAGDSVEWKNEDIFTHTVSANDGGFDSGPIAPGGSWRTTIKKAGSIAYHCEPHPNMSAELIVQSPGEHGGGVQSAAEGTLKWTPPNRPEQIHPILVNFTAALLPLAFLSDVLGRIFRRPALHSAGFWMVLYAAVITPFTALAGWWWKSSTGGHADPTLIVVHQWLGTAAALVFIALAVWRWWIYKRRALPSAAYLAFALLAVLALVYQGSLGGAMVFGR